MSNKEKTTVRVAKKLLPQHICIGILKKRGKFIAKSRGKFKATRDLSLEALNKLI